MSDAISYHIDSEAFDTTDRLLFAFAVTHHARQFERLRDPAAIFLAVEIDR